MHNLPSWTTNFGCLLIYIDGLVQDCSISIANALEILQSCIKPSIWWNDVIPKLEIEQRINHKIIQLTYKAQHGKAPAYLSSLLSRIRGQTSTHSSSVWAGCFSQYLLHVPNPYPLKHASYIYWACPVHSHLHEQSENIFVQYCTLIIQLEFLLNFYTFLSLSTLC